MNYFSWALIGGHKIQRNSMQQKHKLYQIKKGAEAPFNVIDSKT